MEKVFREGCAFAERLYGGSTLDGMASGIMTWFAGGHFGPWRVLRIDPVIGNPLAWVPRLEIAEQPPDPATDGWVLRGVTSFERYVTRAERVLLEGRQQGLGRPSATRAALIPVRKSPAWWDLPQDERRAIFEERAHHIQTGLEYLPAVARRLYHCREMGEPFDFLTWFEYAPDHARSFEELVGRLRRTEEWRFVEREVDIRLAMKVAP